MKKQRLKVAIYGVDGPNYRGRVIGRAMHKGLQRFDLNVSVHGRFKGRVEADVAIAYGWIHELTDKVFSKHRDAGAQYVFFDLGFWDRGETGHHRIAINDWDSGVNNLTGCPSDRWDASGLKIHNRWNPQSRNVMIAGMSGKAAWTHGYKKDEWENKAKVYLTGGLPKYRVYVRPKPSSSVPKELTPKIDKVLPEQLFVLAHHSNVAVDCLRWGIPYYVVKGAGKRLSQKDFVPETILNPTLPDPKEVQQLLWDIGHWQYDIGEMKRGLVWDYIRRCLK